MYLVSTNYDPSAMFLSLSPLLQREIHASEEFRFTENSTS